MRNLIVEGARGLGKSSITRFLREHTTNSTLINFTGFNESGEEGADKVTNYYQKWSEFFNSLRAEDITFIHDRYFFSEMVYSSLYKSYNFRPYYDLFVRRIPMTFDNVTLVVLWSNSYEELERNLTRDKAQLFGEVEESVVESLEQQLIYLQLTAELKVKNIPNLTVKILNVKGKTIEQIGHEILALM